MAIIFPIAYKTDTSGLKKAQSEFGQFAKGLKSTLGALGVGLGVAEVANQLRDAAKAAVEDSKSQALLANALKNTVGASSDQIASVEESIHQMQMQASVADDVIRPAFTSLVTSTHDVASATDLMGVALDLAAYKGVDLQTAADALAKAHQGVTKGLFQLMPELRNSANYMDTLRANTAGAAEAAANNDPFQQMSIVIQDLQEKVGYYLLPALKDLAKYVGSKEFSGVMNDALAPFDAMSKAMENLNKVIPGLKLNFTSLFSGIANSWKMTFMGLLINNFNNFVDKLAVLNGTKLPQNLINSNNASSSRLTNAALAYQASQGGANSGGIDLHPMNPKPGQVYTFMNYADGANAPAVWWTQTWTGKTWTKAKRMTYTTSSGKSSGANAAQQAADALAQRIQDIKDFKASIATNLNDLIPEARVTSEMGDFQKKVIEGFDAVAQSMQDAFDNKLILADSLAVFRKYAAGERAALEQIAKARDVLSKKIDIAKQLTQSVRDMGNITNAINKQSETVTESYTKVIDGVNVTISKTMEVAKATDVVASYKAIIDKTKTFASNLKALKAAGLNGQLFSQIVSAGVDAGGQTAAAIVAGGADTIGALNDLFGQLDDTATSIAAVSTDIMYQTGLEVTNGFIQALIDQDAALQVAATNLATNFNNAFKAALNIAVPSSGAAPGKNAATDVGNIFNTALVPNSVDAGKKVGEGIVNTIEDTFKPKIEDLFPKDVVPTTVVPPEIANPAPVIPISDIPTVTTTIKTGMDQIAASFDTSGIVAAGGFMPSNYGTGAAGSVQGAVIDAVNIAKRIKADTGSNLSVSYFTKAVTNAMNGLEGSTATMQKWTNIASNYLQSAMASAQPTFGAASVSPTYNVTVNAGLGTDGNSIGVQLVNALTQYERTNGAVWQRAV